MKAVSLLLLRFSLGLLMLIWGVDKILNTQHAVDVSKGFYFDLFSAPLLLQVFGVLQCVLALLILVGLFRRFTYPVLIIITAVTLIGVMRSVIDPLGLFLEGTNVLFFPSLGIFASALTLFAFQAEDRHAMDSRAG